MHIHCVVISVNENTVFGFWTTDCTLFISDRTALRSKTFGSRLCILFTSTNSPVLWQLMRWCQDRAFSRKCLLKPVRKGASKLVARRCIHETNLTSRCKKAFLSKYAMKTKTSHHSRIHEHPLFSTEQFRNDLLSNSFSKLAQSVWYKVLT